MMISSLPPVSWSLLSSSSRLLIIFLCAQCGDDGCLVMETWQAGMSVTLESVRYSRAVCDKRLQRRLLGVPAHRARFTACHSLQGRCCRDDVP